MIKHVTKNVLNMKNQKIIIADIMNKSKQITCTEKYQDRHNYYKYNNIQTDKYSHTQKIDSIRHVL